MIEFKAECGHTVRAKDEDAGGVVRCSYCGKTANVPDPQGDELDFLFSDVHSPDEENPRQRRNKKKKVSAKRKPGDINPFAIVLRMCYAALLLIIVLVVGKKFVMPLFEEGGFEQIITNTSPKKPEPKPTVRTPRNPIVKPAARVGLISRNKFANLYTTSTPPGAAIFFIQSSRAPATGRIFETDGVQRLDGAGKQRDLSDGSYAVEVVFPWNHSNLTGFPEYKDFRRALQDADASQRNELIHRFFIPDEATDFFVNEIDGQFYLVRQYRDVVIRNRRSRGVRALFLPRIKTEEKNGFSIEALVNNYIPTDENYSFDKNHVRSELNFYDVSDYDQKFVMKALTQIGMIPYRTADDKLRLFKIDIDDGSFAAKVLHD